MKKIFALLIAVVMCVSLFAACGEKTGNENLDKKILLEVEGVKVSQAFYNFIYGITYSNAAQNAQYYGEDWENMELEEGGKTIGEYIIESTQTQVEQLVAVRIYAEKYGITEKDVEEAVKEQKKQVIENYGGEEGYVEFLKSSYTTDKAIDYYLASYEILNLLFEKVTQKGEVGYISEKDLEKAFNEEYKDKLRVQHILISTMADEQTGAPGKTDAEALKIANEVIAKLDKGEDFDTLIPDYNEDPGMSSGQYYVFAPGEMVEEFENASKELKVGEYTKKPVKSDYGYHIIKKYEINKEIPEYEEFTLAKKQEKTISLIEEESKTITFEWNEKAVEEAIKYLKDEIANAKAASETETAETEAAETEAAE